MIFHKHALVGTPCQSAGGAGVLPLHLSCARQCGTPVREPVALSEVEPMSDPKTIMIILLLAAVAVLGYLYYESQQTAVKIDVPGFKLEAK